MMCQGLDTEGTKEDGETLTVPQAEDRLEERVSTDPYPGPLPKGWSLPTVLTPLERGQGQQWEMTAGGESTKVQFTTGGKAISSNRHPESQWFEAETRAGFKLRYTYSTNCSMKSMCSFSPGGYFSGSSEVPGCCCVPTHRRLFTFFPSLIDERLFF